jgi:hypothetical protein
MKLIFNADGTLWIISRNGRHPDVDGCTSVLVGNDFEYVKERQMLEFDEKVIYKTLDEVHEELGVQNA